MFRPMRRIRQQLPDEEALEVLKSARRGVLSVTGDDGWPYGVWLNPYYREADGRIYFHGAKEGHKIDALRRDARVSFTVIDDGVQDEGGWAYTFRTWWYSGASSSWKTTALRWSCAANWRADSTPARRTSRRKSRWLAHGFG